MKNMQKQLTQEEFSKEKQNLEADTTLRKSKLLQLKVYIFQETQVVYAKVVVLSSDHFTQHSIPLNRQLISFISNLLDKKNF